MARKEITRIAKIQLKGGQAKPGPELASIGINMADFTKKFNEQSKDRMGEVVPCVITAYNDRTFEFVIKTSPVAFMLKKAAKIELGAKNQKTEKVGKISREKALEIARYKLVDLNANDEEAALRMVAGTAKQMGIEIEGVDPMPVSRKAINEATTLVRDTSTVKFDASVDVSVCLNLDTAQANQQLRGAVSLPHGNGKTVKILALAEGDEATSAKASGADFVGGKEKLDEIKEVFKTRKEVPSKLNNKIELVVIEEYDLDKLANALFVLRQAKGMTLTEASSLVRLPNYFASMLLKQKQADGYVGGIEMTTRDTLKPALQIIKSAPGFNSVTSLMLMERGPESYVWGDCALIPDPSAQELADTARNAAIFARQLAFDSLNVAFLSYSTAGSGIGPSADKARSAVALLAQDQKFIGTADSEYQFDSAFVPAVRDQKHPASTLEKKPADIYIFPNLDAGNIGYKIAQRLGGFEATGPLLVGMNQPVNDLSRGASVDDIVNVAYLTAVQALPIK
ncbi:unnamed protein product [Didymodactylos carnosus]|uniref:Large ribosomal subunit protein uL11 n=1 Tax=Didymodactylos carnosus TaxID=1234261 RepID=A0A8S2CZ30_9BILA|nr:unnamed protein product [Didymodactylos carnosus]CAF3540413.1 unnamed protein product [Didymodactylos carnosus]